MASTPKFQDTQPDLSHTERTGKGMPARTPQTERDQESVQLEHTQQDVSDEASLAMPHERDQSTDMTGDKPDLAVKQAKKDVDAGKKDTTKAPEMNTAYQKQK